MYSEQAKNFLNLIRKGILQKDRPLNYNPKTISRNDPEFYSTIFLQSSAYDLITSCASVQYLGDN